MKLATKCMKHFQPHLAYVAALGLYLRKLKSNIVKSHKTVKLKKLKDCTMRDENEMSINTVTPVVPVSIIRLHA